MLSCASGNSGARWNEAIVGNIVSSSPFTTRTGFFTFVSPAGELPCSHLARAVSWAPIVSLDTGASRSAVRSSKRARNASAAAWLFAVGEKNRKCFGCFPWAPAFSIAAWSTAPVSAGPGCRAGQDDASDQIRSLLDDHLGDHAAEGVSEQVNLAQPERIEKCHRVGGHRLDAVGGSATRTADTAKVDQDDAVLGGDAVDHGGVPIVEDGREVMKEYHRHPGG